MSKTHDDFYAHAITVCTYLVKNSSSFSWGFSRAENWINQGCKLAQHVAMFGPETKRADAIEWLKETEGFLTFADEVAKKKGNHRA